MEAGKSEADILLSAIAEWEHTGKLSPEQAADLRRSIELKQSPRQQIAQYFFFIALFCTLLAFAAIFLNEKLLEKIKLYFSWSDMVIALITAVLSVLWFWYISRKKKSISEAAYEVYMVLGGLSVLTSLVYWCKEIGIDKTYTAFLSIALPLLAVLAHLFRSRALWIGAIATAIIWFGAVSTWQSVNNMYLGMNYPVRYTVFGLVILGISFVQQQVRAISFAWRITYLTGLFAFFTGLWGVSIFGNYGSLAEWHQVRQIHVLAWSVVFAVAAAVTFYLGVKYKDETARDMGVLFLLINLYTRYFEYFWDTMNKGIFFLVLAITFGFLGWWLERKIRTTSTK